MNFMEQSLCARYHHTGLVAVEHKSGQDSSASHLGLGTQSVEGAHIIGGQDRYLGRSVYVELNLPA